MPARRRMTIAALLIALPLALATSVAAQPPMAPSLSASANGQNVSASWNAVAGATSYRVEAGFSPALMLAGYEMGGLTTFSLTNVPQGLYYLRVLARNGSGLSAPSNVVSVSITTSVAPPLAPSNLTASVSGSTITLNAQLPPGPLSGLLLVGGTAPGSTQAAIPLSVSPTNSVTDVPPGTYYGRLVALNAGGPSAPSNEVQMVVTAATCAAPAAPVVTSAVNGLGVVLSWTSVAGAVGYRLDVSMTPGGAPMISQPFPPSQTGVASPNTPPGTYYARVVVSNACGETATSSEATVTVVAPPPGTGNRTPNPPPGQRLPLPNRSSVVTELAQQFSAEIRNSCVSSGGNNAWLYRLVQRLRLEDTRWGLNWKRGRVGDMSQDVINYNWGPESDEGTRNVYVVDVIGGHCGPSPSGAWFDVTGPADAIWTLQPYTAAGYPR